MLCVEQPVIFVLACPRADSIVLKIFTTLQQIHHYKSIIHTLYIIFEWNPSIIWSCWQTYSRFSFLCVSFLKNSLMICLQTRHCQCMKILIWWRKWQRSQFKKFQILHTMNNILLLSILYLSCVIYFFFFFSSFPGVGGGVVRGAFTSLSLYIWA